MWVTAIIFVCTCNLTSGQCDPDPPIPLTSTDQPIVTFCGSTFNLCMDMYDISDNVKPDTFPLNVFTNDSGDFDYCLSTVPVGYEPLHGELIRLPDCRFAYIPGPSFSTIDSFDYCVIINEECTNIDYCTGTDGKIINIYAKKESF